MPNPLIRHIPDELNPAIAQALLNFFQQVPETEWVVSASILKLTASDTNEKFDAWLSAREVQA